MTTNGRDITIKTAYKNSLWISHGTQVIPKAQFEGKEKVKNFKQHLNRTEMLSFEPRQYIVEGNILVVLAANIKE